MMRLTFDMGRWPRAPARTSPLDGRVRQHCVFARMPGVFEPCTRLDHLGWLRYLPLKPRFLVAWIARKLLGRRSVWILVTFGSLNSNSTRARTSLVPALPGCDAFASDWSIPRTWIGFPPSVPASKSNVRLAYLIGSPFSIAMYGVTDLALKRLASTVPVRQQVSGVLFSAPPLTI